MPEDSRGCRPLSGDEWGTFGEQARAAVFNDPLAHAEPFTAAMSDRLIVFPVDYDLDRAQLGALAVSARAVGDQHCLLDLLVHLEDEPSGWWVDFGDYDGYRRPFKLENALFSPTGQWGFSIVQGSWAVVGGVPAFVEAFLRAFPNVEPEAADEGVQGFLRLAKWLYRTSGSSIDVPALLTHIYGGQRAETLLNEIGWNDPAAPKA